MDKSKDEAGHKERKDAGEQVQKTVMINTIGPAASNSFEIIGDEEEEKKEQDSVDNDQSNFELLTDSDNEEVKDE